MRIRQRGVYGLAHKLIENAPDDSRYTIVNGYHATSKRNLDGILNSGFKVSRNPEDWLGDGAYFWQEAPKRAWEWARSPRQRAGHRIGDDPIVIGVRLLLPFASTMDLFDCSWSDRLRDQYYEVMTTLINAGIPIQKIEEQTRQSGDLERPVPRRLDRLVVNGLVNKLLYEETRIVAVRAPFPEGRHIYPEAGFRRAAHVQIAIRDHLLIDPPDPIGNRRGLWLEPEPSDSI